MDQNNKDKDDQQRTEEVQDIIEKMPRKFGIIVASLVVSIILLLLVFGWFVEYPDVVAGRITVNTEQAPIKLVAPYSGKLQLTGIKSKDIVETGEVIAWIENTTSLSEVIRIEALLQNVSISDKEKIVSYYKLLPKNTSLGELSTKYYSFLNAVKLFVHHRENELYIKQIKAFRNLLKEQINVLETTINMSNITGENLDIIEKFKLRDSILHKKEFLSDAELDQTTLQKINARKQYQSSIKEVTFSREKIKQTEKSIQELYIIKAEKEQQLDLELSRSFNELKDAISNWKKQYLFIAPFAGKVQFLNFWDNKQFVQTGTPIFTIVPHNEEVIGEVMLPSRGAGKVKTDQNVIIKLDNYPYMEYGSIEGKVKDISLTTNTVESSNGKVESYLIKVVFPNGLETDFKKKVLYKSEMKGFAEIITNNRKLIERFFDNLRIKR